jgi:glycosyltransferase involved in cell wall biosynthesis/peptidoglycan/xylan/chitin deacetylase (PgdA/CDA1 family)
MPKLSVIIPTYERCKNLTRCLRSLESQTLDASRFEVIVIVDGSDDGTIEFLEGYEPKFPLIHEWQTNSGQGAARNNGAGKASGNLFVFLDDDVIAGPALLQEHLNLAAVAGTTIGIGNIRYEADCDDWYIQAYSDNWNQYFAEMPGRTPNWRDLYSGNVSIPRKLFEDSGGFATHLPAAEDADLGCRLQAVGGKFRYAPGAIVYHPNNKTKDALIREAGIQGAATQLLSRQYRAVLADLSKSFHTMGLLPLALFQFGHAARISPSLLGRFRLGTNAKRAAVWQKNIQQYAFWIGVRQAAKADDKDFWSRLVRGVPILAYHAFTEERSDSSRYVVVGKDFEAQMRYLSDRGYRAVSLAQYLTLKNAGRLPTLRTIVITVDDGYTDFAQIAWPAMRDRGFTGTVFVVTERAGHKNSWDSDGALAGRTLMSWEQLEYLAGEGIEIGGHSRTHAMLTESTDEQLVRETRGARKDIETSLGRTAETFAFPYGEYDSRVLEAASAGGYSGACTVIPGLNTPADDDFRLRRVEIFGDDALWAFKLKARFGAKRPRLRQLLQGL